ncbi:hypothetical protein ACPEIC_47075 [Stenotrophomonas sp. NPDC087984]
MCGSHDGVEVHHIRHLKDLTVRGQALKPAWVQMMAARRRKTLVVCRVCHEDIHYGRVAHGRTHEKKGRWRAGSGYKPQPGHQPAPPRLTPRAAEPALRRPAVHGLGSPRQRSSGRRDLSADSGCGSREQRQRIAADGFELITG